MSEELINLEKFGLFRDGPVERFLIVLCFLDFIYVGFSIAHFMKFLV